MKFQNIPALLYKGLFLFLISLPIVSCRKNNSPVRASDNLQGIANRLGGIIIKGSIATESGNDAVVILCNEGNIAIGMGKIPLHDVVNPPNIEHAEIIYSDFGIIISDTDSRQKWYYIQNDDKSQKTFEGLHLAKENAFVSGITGSIKIKLS